ncbi:MAG: hypothetical protein KKC76_13350 [Proteobacteria bacterium]|nr:hypothetical protein [Pseudomonadota bacterium]MBU4296483.1 hypothetical protein [Pseudomonadota bacterium]MCG2749665.1 hypothetical protein [Desulfobulbaceae bacterium]
MDILNDSLPVQLIPAKKVLFPIHKSAMNFVVVCLFINSQLQSRPPSDEAALAELIKQFI